MELRRMLVAVVTALFLPIGSASADSAAAGAGQLGKVSFTTSCDKKVQADFDRAVAMLHSFWFSYAEKAFRELLGDMLLELKQPAAALKEYEASHAREPNRFRGYYGAAKAAEESGQRAKAAEYYRKLLALAKNADSLRPEIAHAKTYVAQR